MREVVRPADEKLPLLFVILHVIVDLPVVVIAAAAMIEPPSVGAPRVYHRFDNALSTNLKV